MDLFIVLAIIATGVFWGCVASEIVSLRWAPKETQETYLPSWLM